MCSVWVWGTPAPPGNMFSAQNRNQSPRSTDCCEAPGLSSESLHWGQDSDKVLPVSRTEPGAAAAPTSLGFGRDQVFREAASLGRGAGVGGEGIAWLAVAGGWPSPGLAPGEKSLQVS